MSDKNRQHFYSDSGSLIKGLTSVHFKFDPLYLSEESQWTFHHLAVKRRLLERSLQVMAALTKAAH